MKMVWNPNPKINPDITGAAQCVVGVAVQASQNMLIVRQGPAMQDMGSRWYSGLEVQTLLSFLAFS